MGVQFDRILDGFDGPFEKLTDFAKVPAGADRRTAAGGRLLLQPPVNDSFIASTACSRPTKTCRGCANGPMGYGTFYVAAKPTTLRAAAEGRDRPRHELRGDDDGADRADRRSCASCASASSITYGGGMPVGLDAADLQELRIPVREDSENDVFPPDTQRRQPAREVRRARVQRRGLLGRRRRWRGGGGGGGGGGDVPPAAAPPPARRRPVARQALRRSRRGGARRAAADAGGGGQTPAAGDDRPASVPDDSGEVREAPGQRSAQTASRR